MELLEQNAEFLGVCPTKEVDMLKHIEYCGRQCYQSTHKISENSYLKFFNIITSNGHESVLSHSNIVFQFVFKTEDFLQKALMSFITTVLYRLSYFRFITDYETNTLTISGNIRIWLDFLSSPESKYFVLEMETIKAMYDNYPSIAKFIGKYNSFFSKYSQTIFWTHDIEKCNIGLMKVSVVPVEEQMELGMRTFDIPMLTFKFLSNRGISHEAVRHTTLIPSQESSRYVNYSPDAGKSQNGVGYIVFDTGNEELQRKFMSHLESSERLYNDMISFGIKPQYARDVLPHSMKTLYTMSGRPSAWLHFVKMRYSPAAHPEIYKLGKFVHDTLYNLGFYLDVTFPK